MKIIARNRRARFDYDIREKLVAGIVLTGAEVKSAKAGHISLKGTFASVNRGELWLVNSHISPYKYASLKGQEATRNRKLLIHKQELARLLSAKQSGLSIIPLAVGIERGLVKVELGLGRGLKKYDKREALKTRQAKRQIARRLHSKT